MAVYFGTQKVLSTVSMGTHADTHAAQGPDPISPDSIGAAPSGHTHNGYASSNHDHDLSYASINHTHNVAQIRVVSLTAENWISNIQSVSVSGISNDFTKQVIFASPAPYSFIGYTNAGVRCTSHGTNTLTFTASTAPYSSLDVYVAVLEVRV